MTISDAIAQLTKAYREKFFESPSQTDLIVISLMAPRVLKGEKFVWREHNENWRILEKEPNHEPE